MTSCGNEIYRYFAFDGASALFAVVLFCCTRNCTSNDPEIGGIVLIVCGISQVIAGALLATVLYPSDCINFWDAPYGFVVALIGICWITRGFGLLLGGNNDDNNDEQERINRRTMMRQERRSSSVRIGSGSGIYGDRSSLSLGQALESPLLQSAEERMP